MEYTKLLGFESFLRVNWLFLVSLIDLLGASLFMPLFGSHLRSLGLSNFNVGLLSSAYHGSQLISAPIVGKWSDMYGRKSVLLFTISICAICYCCLGFTSSFTIMLMLRLTLGVLKHTQSLCKTLVADVLPPNEQTSSHGKLNAVTSLGFMIGPLLGGYIIEMENGFLLASLTSGTIFLINGFIIWIFLSNNESKRKIEYTNLKSKVKTSFSDLLNINWWNNWNILLLKFLFALSMSLFYSNYIPTIRETFELSQKYVGYTVSFQGFISTIFSMSIGKINNLYDANSSKYSQLLHASVVLSLSFIMIGFAQSFYVYIFFIIFLQASAALLRTITTELLIERSSLEHRGSVVGTGSSIVSIAKLFGPLITGYLADKFSHGCIPFVATVIAFMMCLLCLVLKKSLKTRKAV